jgi:hypothetical protein
MKPQFSRLPVGDSCLRLASASDGLKYILPINHAAAVQMFQSCVEVQIAIDEQADARALAFHLAEKFGVGDPLIAAHHLHRHRALRNRR